uniref:ATP synthase complex subunit 8 n=1 Tax=Xinidium sp. XIN01 TaxID=1205590 RepID=A0A0S2MRH5_9SCAR|nr:ATP synthase F0 subunit 8 [Xinidium sp. XIN01]
MPQMAPMNWLLLLFYFMIIFMIFNVKNYYSFMYKIKSYSFDKKITNMTWKW